MKKQLLLIAISVMVTVSHADGLNGANEHRTSLHQRIQQDAVQLDHIARIGKYDYEVYVDRSVTPFDVAVKITDASRARQQKYADPQAFIEDLKKHRTLAVEYMNSLRGTPDVSVDAQPVASLEFVSADRPIETCPDRFPKSLYMTADTIGPEHVGVDQYGRPTSGWVEWKVPAVPARRYEDCQAKVGKMGGRGADDDGGHLVAAILGGWGKRANLVPQNRTLNRGLWRDMGSEVATCTVNGYSAYHLAIPIYDDTKNPGALRPSALQAVTHIQSQLPPWDTYDGTISSILNESPDDFARKELKRVITGMQKFCVVSCPSLTGSDGSCKA